MRFKDLKDSHKLLSKVPGPWVPGYYALLRGKEKRDANQSKNAKK